MYTELYNEFLTKHTELLEEIERETQISVDSDSSWYVQGCKTDLSYEFERILADYFSGYLTEEGAKVYAARKCNDIINEIADNFYVSATPFLLAC